METFFDGDGGWVEEGTMTTVSTKNTSRIKNLASGRKGSLIEEDY